MYERFLTLPLEKQNRILSSALMEFGKYGFKKTSVEQIALKANISKAMIFHYFGTKLALFEFLISYSYDFIKTTFGNIEELIRPLDYIEQYREVTKIKLKAYTENPFIFSFISMLYMHPDNIQVSEKVNVIYGELMEMRDLALHAIEFSLNIEKFRKDIDVARTKKYISWIIEGYSQLLIAKVGDKSLSEAGIDYAWDEFDEILDDLKKIFY